MDLDSNGPGALLSAPAAQGLVPDQVMVGLRSGGPLVDFGGYLAAQNWPGSVGAMTPQRAKNIFSRPVAGGEYLSIVRMDLPFGSDVSAAAQELSTMPFVAWAAPNFVYEGQLEFTPNDPLASKQYHHALMENLSAWDTTLGSGSVILAVTDTGVDWNHVDLSPNIWSNPGEIAGNGLDDDANGYIDDVRGWDFSDNDADPKEEGGTNHGTHVAGIAAARTNNATGVAGTAGGITLMPLRISASPTSDTYAAAYAYAADNGARIVSTSFNVDGRVGDPTYEAALQYLYESGVLHLNSAGNDNASEPRRQTFHQSLFVANTTSSDTREGTSNYGTGIDISAPGTVIRSTLPGNNYGLFTGTSMAAPNAAGVAALIWSAHPTWSRDQVAAQLIGTADSIDQLNPAYSGLLGSGRVNSFRAVTETLAPPGFDGVSELGAAINPTIAPLSKLTINLASVFDEAAIENVGSWDLRSDGPNGVFGDADDVVVGLAVTTDYMIGTNSVELAFALLPDDHYRFTAGRGLLVDPFGTPLDGNLDGTGGDDFVREFTVDSSVPVTIGPDAFGYLATAVAPEFQDIAATGTVILANVDDGTAKLSDASLADFQFQFYGVTHTELYASSNGLITFVSANSAFGNTDLTTSPSQASIAVLWDDQTTANGADAVYWQVLGSGGDERLIVQWNEIDYFGGTDPITFQAVLYEADGSIQLNFLDLAGGDTQDEGAAATVGIKASGTQGTTGDRLLISRDEGPNAFVGTGLSTRIAISIVVPDVSIGNFTSVEDNGGVTTAFDFLVKLSEPTTATVTVEVSTVDGSATESDGDFTALVALAITFLPGEVSKTVTVDVAGDDRYEGDEAFSVVLGNPIGGVIAGGQGVGTIVDDDKPTLSLAVNLYQDASGVPGPAIAGDLVTVGQTFFVEVVAADLRLAPAGLVALSIDAAWDNPSLDEIDSPFDPADAASPLVTADFPLARSGVLDNATATVFGLSGESSPGTGQGAAIGVGAAQRFSVMRFRADAATNGYLSLNLALGAAGVVFADAAADFNLAIEAQSIRVIPTLAVTGGSVTEGDTGTKSLQFTVSLATPSPEVVTAQVDTSDGTATEADGDYLGISGLVLTFDPGETIQTVAVDILGDTTVEPSETLDVHLSAATNAAIATASATLTIINDDVSDPLDVGLVTYWSFDEGAGATAADGAPFGQGDPGTLGGDTAWSPEGLGGSVSFDGTGDYVDIPDSADINLGIHAQETVAFWFKAADATISSRKQVLYEQGGSSRGLSIYLYNGLLYIGGWNTTATQSNWQGTFLSAPVTSGAWHHAALVLNGTSSLQPGALAGYLDGSTFAVGDGSQI